MSTKIDVLMISSMKPFTQYSMDRLKEESDSCNIRLQIIAPNQLGLIPTAEGIETYIDQKKQPTPDILFVKTGASTIQPSTLACMKMLELLPQSKTRVINPSSTYETFGDKWSTFLHLKKAGLPTPETLYLSTPQDLKQAALMWDFPLVLKEIRGARGNSVVLIENLKQGQDLIEILMSTCGADKQFILQKCVQASKGRDVRVLVCGGKPFAAIDRIAQKGGFKANVSQGGNCVARPLDDQIQQICTQISQSFGLNYGGIDLLIDPSGYQVCEVNLAAQFVGIEKATGMNAAKQCLNGLRLE